MQLSWKTTRLFTDQLIALGRVLDSTNALRKTVQHLNFAFSATFLVLFVPGSSLAHRPLQGVTLTRSHSLLPLRVFALYTRIHHLDMDVNHRGRGTSAPEFGMRGTLMQIVHQHFQKPESPRKGAAVIAASMHGFASCRKFKSPVTLTLTLTLDRVKVKSAYTVHVGLPAGPTT